MIHAGAFEITNILRFAGSAFVVVVDCGREWWLVESCWMAAPMLCCNAEIHRESMSAESACKMWDLQRERDENEILKSLLKFKAAECKLTWWGRWPRSKSGDRPRLPDAHYKYAGPPPWPRTSPRCCVFCNANPNHFSATAKHIT